MEKISSPWSVSVMLDQIPETGLHMEIEAPEPVRAAIARLAGVRGVSRLSATFDLSRRGAGVQVDGHVSGHVGQTCVVTLEPIESDVEEDIDLLFVPQTVEEAVTTSFAAEDYAADTDGEPPEALIGGKVDLGAIATEFLILGLDPYPRKPGAAFSPPQVEEKEAHPFSALAALKKGRGEGKR